MLLTFTKRIALLALAVAAFSTQASVVFFDSSFNLANYTTTPTFIDGVGVTAATTQCAGCGNPGSALDITMNVPGADGLARVGLLNNGFLYNPTTQGPLASIGVFVDENLIIAVANLNGFNGVFGNTLRPLIQQGGVFYMATIPGPPLPQQGTTGYLALGQAALHAADFFAYDFSTNTFGAAHPDFTGSQMLLGLGQISGVSVGNVFTGTTITARYDNLRFALNAVPEPPTLALLDLALIGCVVRRRAGRRG